MARKPNQVKGVFEKNEGSGIWYVRYRNGGNPVTKMIGDRDEAVAYIGKVRLVKMTGEGVLAKSAKGVTRTKEEIDGSAHKGVTISELCDDYLAHIQDPQNHDRPKDQVNPPHRIETIKEAFGDRHAASLMPYEVVDWLKGLKRKPATLNRYRSTFSSIYRYGKERAKVSINPVRETSQHRVFLPNPRWLRPEEEIRLRAVLKKWIDECPDEPKLKKLFLSCHPIELTVALGTGMRKGNQYKIAWSKHVDMLNRSINLPPSMTKTGKPQTIPLIDDVYESLVNLQDIQDKIKTLQKGQKSKRMVANGRVFNTTENREWWAAALKEAKIHNFRWHDLRHTFATRLTASTGNLKITQEACGHGSITTTARYAHVSNKDLQDAMAGLNSKR